MSRLHGIICFETTLVVFIFAGYLKTLGQALGLPVDIAILAFAVSLCAGLALWFLRGATVPESAVAPVCLFAALAAWVGLSQLWSPGVEYAQEKAARLLSLAMWAFVAASVVVVQEEERVNRLLVGLRVGGLLYALMFALYTRGALVAELAHSSGPHYLGPGRAISLAAVLACAAGITASRRLPRFLWLLATLLMFAALMAIGARQAVVGFLLALLVPPLLGVRVRPPGFILWRRYWATSSAVLGLIVLGVVASVILGASLVTVQRLQVLLEQPGGGVSAAGRLAYYASALDLWAERPLFGHGVGAWPILNGMGDVQHYPHNIILELLVEQGIVGFGFLALLFAVAMKRLGRREEIAADPCRLTLLMVLVLSAFQAMVTGDLNDNRTLFLVLGLFMWPRAGCRLHARASAPDPWPVPSCRPGEHVPALQGQPAGGR